MNTQSKQSLNSFGREQGKNTHFTAQLKRVYDALMQKPMTMKEVDIYTGVMRENICRYIDVLSEQNKIAVIKKRKCNVTGYPYVNEYTTNPSLFPKSNQLKMF
jgi:hypothetical protein